MKKFSPIHIPIDWPGKESTSLTTSSLFTLSAQKIPWQTPILSSRVGAQYNFSIRPSRINGAYKVEKSFPITTIGTQGFSCLLYMLGSWTLVGLSTMFMRVELTTWLFNVYRVVPPILPAPASRSLMKSTHTFPFLIMSDASWYHCLINFAGSPASPISSSPVLIIIGLQRHKNQRQVKN